MTDEPPPVSRPRWGGGGVFLFDALLHPLLILMTSHRGLKCQRLVTFTLLCVFVKINIGKNVSQVSPDLNLMTGVMHKQHQRVPLLRCMILNFHRQINLAFQSKEAMEQEVNALRLQNALLLQEVQMANKNARHYFEDLHSAESDLYLHKEKLIKLKIEGPCLTSVFQPM